MNTYIAFLRGINVGGHRKVPMADLRIMLTKQGYDGVRTYIQSGNVLFVSDKNTKELEIEFEELIRSNFGFHVDVIIKTPKDIETIIHEYPFSEDNIIASYFIMFKEQPAEDKIDAVNEIKLSHDHFKIKSNVLYLFPEKGYGKSKFNLRSIESKLGVSATARNYKTMTKLLSLSLN